jgi:hypothetical protein
MKYAIISAAASLALLQGCVTVRDHRDAAWDPPPGRLLFEQIPPWDDRAHRICCGHLRECQPHQSPRC